MYEFVLKHRFFFLFAFLLVAIYFPVFLDLDYLPIRKWDESMMGVNAIEMAHNHNYIVTYFLGEPDISNCKPPLLIWCIVLFIKIFGFSELSLRLPSALAAAALSIYLFLALRKYTGSGVFGFAVTGVLITCQGYIRNHVTRTGEYDSLLVLFATVFSLHLFWAAEATDPKRQSKHLLLFFIFLTLGVLTKGIASMMLAPGLFIYALMRKKIGSFLQDKAFYAGLGVFAVFALGYYLLRESMNPGYLVAVWQQELGGRFAGMPGHREDTIAFYLNEIIRWQFISYLFLFPVALIVGLWYSDSRVTRLVQFSAITGFSFLVVISVAGTKLPHYDAPLFPFLAIIMAALFFRIFLFFRDDLTNGKSRSLSPLIAFVCILGFFGKPYFDIISKVYLPHGDSWEEGFSRSCEYFQEAAKHQAGNYPHKLIFDIVEGQGEGAVLACYREELAERGIKTAIMNRSQIHENDTAIVFDGYVKQLIEQDYEVATLQHIGYCDADVIVVKCRR